MRTAPGSATSTAGCCCAARSHPRAGRRRRRASRRAAQSPPRPARCAAHHGHRGAPRPPDARAGWAAVCAGWSPRAARCLACQLTALRAAGAWPALLRAAPARPPRRWLYRTAAPPAHNTRSRRLHAPPQWAEGLNKPLSETDPEIFDIIEKEKQRQRNSLVLIASEVRAAAARARGSGAQECPPCPAPDSCSGSHRPAPTAPPARRAPCRAELHVPVRV